MKKFEKPEIDIVRFKIEDIITSSSGDNELPMIPAVEDQLNIAEVG